MFKSGEQKFKKETWPTLKEEKRERKKRIWSDHVMRSITFILILQTSKRPKKKKFT